MALFFLLLCQFGCLTDIRPPALQGFSEPQAPEPARILLQQASQSQHLPGGRPWLQQPGVGVRLTDTFSGLTGWFARPWPENPQPVEFRFVPGKDNSVVRLGDTRWGIHEWNTWQQEEPTAAPVYADDDTTSFWLPTMGYFLELPFRLHEAGLVDLAGVVELEGASCDRVYATWVSYGPHPDIDQYVAYLRQSDHRIVRVDFTVRDFAGFVVGTVRYDDFRHVGDYVLPHRVEIGPDPPEDLLHTYEVHEWTPALPLERSDYAPEPDRPAREKP